MADRILAALRAKSPLAPGVLVATLKSTPKTVRDVVSLLEVQGKVSRTGSGPRNTRIHLGKPRAAAKEGL